MLLAFALIGANAFFVAFEFALVKVRATQLEALAEQGRSGARPALDMHQHLDAWLSASQVGITLASLALGWVGEPAFAGLVYGLVKRVMGEGAQAEAAAHTLGFLIAFGLITFLHIVVGEQVPKMMAIAQAERTAMTLAWPMRAFTFVAWPVIWLLNAGTRLVLRGLGLAGGKGDHGEEALGEDELKLVFASSAQP